MQLRPYQIDALNAVKERYAKGHTRQLIVMGTGLGKTVVFSHVPSFLGITKRVLILAHREELIQQAADKFLRWNPAASIGIEKAEQRAADDHQIVVASVQTLRKGSPRLTSLNPVDFGLIITDEAHHATADSYQSIYEHFGVLEDGGKILHLGVTATPSRADGEGLSSIFSEISYNMGLLDAIKQGWLANIRGFRVSTGQSINEVKSRCGDFATDDLAAAVNNENRNQVIVKHWKELAENRQTLVFCVDIAHAKALAAVFETHGIRAEAVWGDDPRREEKVKAVSTGEIKVLCNCQVLVEGYDAWQISCIIMARPTKSQLLFVQCSGRGTRIPEGINNLFEADAAGVHIAKRDCILLDVVDSYKHSLVTLPTLFGLGEKLDMQGKTITEALERFEEVQEEHPQADLKDAPDLDKLNSYAESIDLFTVAWANEVLEGSTLQWHRAPDGHYVLRTKTRRIEVFEDLLQKWNVKVQMGERIATKGNIKDLPDAFSFAEGYVREKCGEELILLRREAAWHKDLASDGQLKLLRKFHVPVKVGLTKGEAQIAITKILSKKGKS